MTDTIVHAKEDCGCHLEVRRNVPGYPGARFERIVHCPSHAAAPDLLAALREAFFQFEHNGDESDSDREVLDKMQAAIAKAEAKRE